MHSEETRLLFYLLAFSGLRLADAALLKWASVNEAKGMIVTHPVKTRQIAREVHIPIHPALKPELEAAKEWKADEKAVYVMPKLAARYNSNPDGINDDIQRVLKWNCFEQRHNVEGMRNRRLYGAHSFRHFFASQCANSGVPISLLADILGDNIATLQKYYIHASDESRRKVIDALPSVQSLPAASTTKKSDSDKLKQIADILQQAKPTAELEAILAVLQS